MRLLRSIQQSQGRKVVASVAGTTVFVVFFGVLQHDKKDSLPFPNQDCDALGWTPLISKCEGRRDGKTFPTAKAASDLDTSIAPAASPTQSWFRRTINWTRRGGRTPRVLSKNDSAFRIPKEYLVRREKDEERLKELTTLVIQERNPDKLWEWNQKALEISFGDGMTVEDRQKFMQRYGCTGWTEEVLDALVALAKDRGIVEVGAGNGQWSRALSEHYQQENTTPSKKNFDFVLAYDDYSAIPLNPEIYNQRTKAYRRFFFDRVKSCGGSSCADVLRQWICRGRALLLVYPPPGEMAVEMLMEYERIGPENDTIVYVGEGRGGANASNTFFEFLENKQWTLREVMEVKSLGTKGYEKLYILQKTQEKRQI